MRLYQKGPCKLPCVHDEFKVLHHIENNKKPDVIIIRYKYKSTQVSIFEEFLVYDFVNFIGSVGGSLGLFIGFSYFDFCSVIAHRLLQLYY